MLRKNRSRVYLNGWICADVRDAILAQDIYCTNPDPKPGTQYGSWFHKGLGTQALRSTREYDLETKIVIRPLTQPLTCEMGSSIFESMFRLKVVSTTWSSLPIIPSTESKNRDFSPLVVAMLHLLFLVDFYHRSKSLSVPSDFQVSASAYPNLKSMIASVWIFHRPLIYTSPCFSGTLPLWCTSSSNMRRPDWIRVSLCTQLG